MPLRDEVRSMEFHQLIMTANLFNVLDSILSSVQIPHHVKPGGYPEDIFINLTSEEKASYECCICYSILKDAKQCVNQHRFCGSCIFVWTTSSVSEGSDRCPMCRAAGYYSSCHTINYKLEIMKVKCQKEGCNWEGYLKHYDDHEHKIYNIRPKTPAPVLPPITPRKTEEKVITPRPAVPAPSETTASTQVSASAQVPAPPSNPRPVTRDNPRLTARFQQARNSNQNTNQNRQNTNQNRQSVSRSRARTQNTTNENSRRNSVSTSRQNGTSNTQRQGQTSRLTSRGTTTPNRIRAGHSLPQRRVQNITESQEPAAIVQSPNTVVVVSDTPTRPPTPEAQTAAPEPLQEHVTIIRENSNSDNNQSSSSRSLNVTSLPRVVSVSNADLPIPTARRNNGPRLSGSNGVSEIRTSTGTNTESSASRSSVPVRDTGLNRVRGIDTNRLQQFQRINQQIRTGRQQLQAIMGILGGEMVQRQQTLQDFQSYDEQRQRRRLEQLQEVNNLGRQLGEVASNLAMLLTGIQEVQREQQNAPE